MPFLCCIGILFSRSRSPPFLITRLFYAFVIPLSGQNIYEANHFERPFEQSNSKGMAEVFVNVDKFDRWRRALMEEPFQNRIL